MTSLSHRLAHVSMSVICAFGALAASGPAHAGAPSMAGSPYFGRWTVDEDRPVFTARGRLYKAIDVAPCGRDFCGVSVDDKGACGVTLFRFLARHATGQDALKGHAVWGTGTKNVVIYASNQPGAPNNGHSFELYLGDGYDFGDRSENMPKFHASYRLLGPGRCTAR